MKQKFLFPIISSGLVANVYRLNPWWQGKPQQPIPPTKRWVFPIAMSKLKDGLAKITVLRGPRQVGKSTLVLQLINALLEEGVPFNHIFYLQFDELPGLRKLEEPILRLADWIEEYILKKSFNEATSSSQPAYLFLDEVQNIDSWAPQLKFLVDTSAIRVLATGSSALRIEQGRDSLAGRISTLEMGPLFLREIAEFRKIGQIAPYLPFNGLGQVRDKNFWVELRQFGLNNKELRDLAFKEFSTRGAYPMAHQKMDSSWEEIADMLNETVIRRAIQHDLRFGAKGAKRDSHLLEEVFRLACRYIGQSPKQSLYVNEIRQTMLANIGWQRILSYLRFLDGTLLLRLIEPLELRLKRRKGPAKLCLCDHALRASWMQEAVPLDTDVLQQNDHLRDMAGHIAESAAGYFLSSIINLEVSHFPERGAEREIDYILTLGEQRIPLEVKYRTRVNREDTLGLRGFIEKSVYNAPFGILITASDEVATDDPRIVSIPLSTLLLMR